MLKKILVNLFNTYILPFRNSRFVNKSFAQAGEDVVMSFLFDGKGIANPSYLELGANYPDYCNNTYLFYLKGSRGVCVEADETLIPKIVKKRKGDKVLNIGVGTGQQSAADFFIFSEKGLNTFSADEARYREKHSKYKIAKIVKMDLKSINEIIESNFSKYPDLLSIDIEGLDLEVLKTLDYNRFPIPVICVETCTFSDNHIKPKDKSIEEFMSSVGYFPYADTYINTIFVNTHWFNSNN